MGPLLGFITVFFIAMSIMPNLYGSHALLYNGSQWGLRFN